MRAGDRVIAGQQIAESGESLYFGIREVANGVVQYLDPMVFLAPNGITTKRAVLISDVLTSDRSGFAGVKSGVNSQC